MTACDRAVFDCASCLQGDGREEVVACAWDGQTYIIDHNRMVVRFQFDENVNAFCAGETLVISLTYVYLIYVMTKQMI